MDHINAAQPMAALALRGIAIFPNMAFHFDVARSGSIKALDVAMTKGDPVFLVAQRDLSVEEPEQEDLYAIGTVCKIRQILRIPGDNVRVMVDGLCRGRMERLLQREPFMMAQVEELPDPSSARITPHTEAMIRQVYDLFEAYCNLAPRVNPETFLSVISQDDPGYIADYIAQNIQIRVEDKQAILEELNPQRRISRLAQILSREVEVLLIEEEMQGKLHEQLLHSQRDHVLREQVRAIQRELGEDEDSEIEEYRRRIQKARLSQEAEEKLNRELSHLEKQPFGSAEATVLRNYLDTVLELPWGKYTKERVNVEAARKVLDADHFGLDKVKERILEFLAVKQMFPKLKGQIICLVGPPGVGKTSVAMSVARAMNRKLASISLEYVHAEAEIRGHRKTYVGAMPGRIVTAVRQAGSMNPLLLLDEIDKIGADQRGDPSYALLEVLDAEQNATFRDHFLEIPFDLSNVLFITTANTTDTIPRPLLDRMEVIELSSYTDEEKLQIAKGHLLPKERARHGLKAAQLRLTDDAIREIITGYTKESGVRILQRQLAAVCRKAAMQLVSGSAKSVSVNGDRVEELLGPRKYHPERQVLLERVGVVNGLAWISVGGELLQVEVNVMPGTGKLELTGNLGDVMKESAHAALTYIRSRAGQWGIEEDFYKTKDIHVHFPEGAIPKDGPSAGVAITTAMVSALCGIPVKGAVAMTGEVTLRGRVLPIGGLREKTMAALRSGIKTVLLPADNGKDLEEIDQTVRAALQFVEAEQVDEVLAEALVHPPARPGRASLAGPFPSKSAGASLGIP
ncbi:MAG: endopeptidase La [Oscillospiraceae bacterium]|nr:endopeptidase La [Oscillospiraceae bacterium]